MVVATSLEDLGGWRGVLGRIAAHADLTRHEAGVALSEILEGNATPSQIAAFIFGLRCKGETVEEMAGMVAAMLAASERVVVPEALAPRLVDTCGTGGDRSGTINVSTIAALVVAGAGVPVCKHGGRAASSRAGSADLLEALGVAIHLSPSAVATCIEETGVGFCFAPRFHPALRHASPTRAELGVPTAFNFLGPLANPARVRRQVVGVGDPSMAEKMCGVLAANGAEHVLVVHGSDGLDELTVTGPSSVIEWRRDLASARTWEVDPVALGITPCAPQALQGGDASTNAALARAVLEGTKGPQRDIVVLNAGAALLVAGIASDVAEGMVLAAAAIDSGAAMAALEGLVSTSQRLGGDA